jgi:tRNA (cmo5U34)-methyltransferase
MSKSSFNKASADWDKKPYRIERMNIFAQAIGKHIPLNEKMKGLDFGCGTGLLGFELLQKMDHMTFWDTSEGMIEEVKNKINDETRAKGEVQNIFKVERKERFDLIVTFQALHHVPDAYEAVKTLADLLNPGGYLCLADLVEEDGSFHQGEVVPHNGFNVEVWEKYLTDLGLGKITTDYPFVNRRERNGVLRDYPLFLTIFQK